MIVFAVLLAYMTVSLGSCRAESCPSAASPLSAGTYNAIARPLGIAIWPCSPSAHFGLAPHRQEGVRAECRVPGALCALVLFIVLMIYFLKPRTFCPATRP